MDPHRAERLSEALREELAEIIEYELSDPRLGGLSVTAVHLSLDRRRAHVLLVSGGDASQRRGALEGLEHAANYLRREISSRLRLWRVPELHFHVDEPSGPASRVEELLQRVREGQKKDTESGEK